MTTRMNPYADHFDLIKPLIAFGQTVQAMGLEHSLMQLVKIRASQINGCARCLHMHAVEARRQGENEDRILMLAAWRECSLYSDREKAALGWTEALTRLAETGGSDDAYEALWEHFSAEEQVKLTLIIIAINGFNRIGAGFRVPPAPAARAAA